jgi:hypothetical protein
VRIRRAGRSEGILDQALTDAGCELVDDAAATLVYVVDEVADLDGFTPEVAAWARAARAAVEADADVITIVGAEGFDTDEPASAMLAHGLVAATRALAFERARRNGHVNLLVVGDARASEVAATVRWLNSAPVTAETVHLGAARHGRLPA